MLRFRPSRLAVSHFAPSRLGATSPLRYERFLEHDCGCDLGRRGFDSIVIDTQRPRVAPQCVCAPCGATIILR